MINNRLNNGAVNNRIYNSTKETLYSATDGKYHLLILKNNSLGIFNGYVGISKKHNFFGKDYFNNKEIESLEVHGGVTYAGNNLKGMFKNFWYFGFDAGHSGDYVPGLSNDLKKFTADLLGEKLASELLKDYEETYKDLDYVTKEVIKLYKQLKDIE